MKSGGKEFNVSLNRRGDGLLVRHIPRALKFMMDYENNPEVRTTNYQYTTTIWGYEEPENNLEMGRALEEADWFLNCATESKYLQILLSTHSPAFYLLKDDEENKDSINLFSVEREKGNLASHVNPIDDTKSVDKDIGMLPLYAPYIEAIENKKKEIAELKNPTVLRRGRNR